MFGTCVTYAVHLALKAPTIKLFAGKYELSLPYKDRLTSVGPALPPFTILSRFLSYVASVINQFYFSWRLTYINCPNAIELLPPMGNTHFKACVGGPHRPPTTNPKLLETNPESFDRVLRQMAHFIRMKGQEVHIVGVGSGWNQLKPNEHQNFARMERDVQYLGNNLTPEKLALLNEAADSVEDRYWPHIKRGWFEHRYMRLVLEAEDRITDDAVHAQLYFFRAPGLRVLCQPLEFLLGIKLQKISEKHSGVIKLCPIKTRLEMVDIIKALVERPEHCENGVTVKHIIDRAKRYHKPVTQDQLKVLLQDGQKKHLLRSTVNASGETVIKSAERVRVRSSSAFAIGEWQYRYQ